MTQEINVVGIDIAKRVFHGIGMDKRGPIILRQRLYRGEVRPFMAQLPPVTIGMEACGGSQYWRGTSATKATPSNSWPPPFVRPSVKSNKNDMRDAEAIAAAVTRPTMRFVPVKDVDHQDIQALHRIRERLLGARTALVTEVHGLMHEYGMVIPKGRAKFRQTVMAKHEADKDKLTALSQAMCGKLLQELAALEEPLASYYSELAGFETRADREGVKKS